MSIAPRFTFGDLDLTEWPFAVLRGSEVDLGQAESVVDIIQSLLPDGEIESLSRRSNRTLVVPILIDATDLAAVADAEAALAAECKKARNTFAVDPGDGYGATTVFDTFWADVTSTRDDDATASGFQLFTLTIRALPFGRSVDLISDDAGTPPLDEGTLLDACESTAGWGTAYNPNLIPGFVSAPVYAIDTTKFSQGTGSLKSRTQTNRTDGAPGTSDSTTWDRLSGLSVSTGTGGYLSIDIAPQWTLTTLQIAMTTTTGGREVVAPFSIARDAQGFTRYVWQVAAGLTVTAIDMLVRQNGPAIGSIGTNPHYVWFDNFQLLPSATTDHQIVKQIDVKGSARTTASLRVAAPTESVALGEVLAITTPTSALPAGFTPDARRWVTQGATTVDATSPDGSYFSPAADYDVSVGTAARFDVPVGGLTAGPYTIVALVKAETSSITTGVRAQLLVGSALVGPTSEAEVTAPTTATGYTFVTVGTVYLPPLPMESADEETRVRLLFKGAKLSNVYMIPAWQSAGRPVADFSIVNCGRGTVGPGLASSSMWIDSPSVTQQQGGWWRGPTPDRLNAQSAWPDARKPGLHTFPPGWLTTYIISTDAQGPTVTLDYYPAWFGSAAL